MVWLDMAHCWSITMSSGPRFSDLSCLGLVILCMAQILACCFISGKASGHCLRGFGGFLFICQMFPHPRFDLRNT